jgi:hypothetical protein
MTIAPGTKLGGMSYIVASECRARGRARTRRPGTRSSQTEGGFETRAYDRT